MSEKKTNKLISQIQDRAKRSLTISEVCINTKLYTESLNYLKNQKYIKFSKIENVLKNNFISNLPLGYVIIDREKKIVGFMGTIFSKKIINGSEYNYCNIHSWIVDEQHRINSFFLLTPLLEKDIILTAFTPVKSLVGLLEKFEFKKMQISYKLVFNFNNFFNKKENFILIKNESEIIKILNKDEIKIYQNYSKLPYEKFVLIDNLNKSRYIFIIASKIKKRGIKTLSFFYISNILEFRKNWKNFKSSISKEFKVNFFSEYFFDSSQSIFPEDLILHKIKKKDICVKTTSLNINLDILYSDLIE
jgi:hypothetical protein